MKKLLASWVILVIAIIVSALVLQKFLPGSISVDPLPGGLPKLFLGAAVLAIVNATIGKLLKFLTLPISCLTFGIFALVINAALFWSVGTLGLGFTVSGFLAAFAGSILVSAVSAVLGVFVPDEKKED